MLCAGVGQITDVQGRVAVFFGKADRRPPGWYWTNAREVGEHLGPITGPFETKADAIEHAIHGVGDIDGKLVWFSFWCTLSMPEQAAPERVGGGLPRLCRSTTSAPTWAREAPTPAPWPTQENKPRRSSRWARNVSALGRGEHAAKQPTTSAYRMPYCHSAGSARVPDRRREECA
jgi:hypothetical protein